jgi:hypothetical protein
MNTAIQLHPDPFDAFWAAYPRKVAKKAARKAFDKALRTTPIDTIMAGLASYIRHKPDYADWMHAASFLNGERWADEYDKPKQYSAQVRGAEVRTGEWWRKS